MNKVLIITYNFLPNSPTFGSVARCTYLYKYLKNHGFDVNVLSVSGKDYGYFGHDDLESDDIHYVKSNLKLKRQQQFNTSEKKNFFLIKYLKKVLQFFNDNLIIPDYSITSIMPIYHKSIKLIDDKNIGTVIISAPPHGLSLVLILLKLKRPKINYILEYRDSWNTQPIFKKNNFLSNKISIFFEKLILKTINTLVYVSPVVPELIKSEIGVDIFNKSELIMNGYVQPKNLKYINTKLSHKSINMAYFGVINDFEKSFRSVLFIDKLISNSNLDIKLDIYGHIEFEKFDVTKSKDINYFGSIDHKDVFDKTQEYDSLIILHTEKHSSFEPIPGKFFDYIQSRKPIICIMSPDAFISKFIVKNRLGIVIDPENIDKTDLKKQLSDFEFNNSFDISTYSREAQFNKYVSLLNRDN